MYTPRLASNFKARGHAIIALALSTLVYTSWQCGCGSHRAIKYREANWGKSYPEDLPGNLSADRSSEELEFQNEQNKC